MKRSLARNIGLAGVLSLGLLTASISSGVSFAQEEGDQIGSINARLDWMEQALIELQSSSGNMVNDPDVTGAPMKMFDDEVAEEDLGDPAAARALTRINELELQIRELTNQLEQINFKIAQAGRELKSLSEDSDYRLRVLEGGDVSSPPPVRAAPVRQTPVEQSLGTVPVEQADGDYQGDYDSALRHLRKGDHVAAEEALQTLLENHGDSELAGHAQYWLGESYYVRKMWTQGARAFATCADKYQSSPKAPDCLLKLGMSLAQIDGYKAQACQAFIKLQREYPNASQTILQRARSERQRNGCS